MSTINKIPWLQFSLLGIALALGFAVQRVSYWQESAHAEPFGIFTGNDVVGQNPVVTMPTVTLDASPSSIGSGQSATLLWTSTDATSLSIDNGIGTVSGPNGTVSVSPTVTTSYVITAANAAGSVTANATVTVSAQPAPTATLSASASTITAGQSVTLTYGSTNATSTSLNQGIGTLSGTSGTRSVSPSVTTTYTLTATGAGGSATDSVTITVNAAPSLPTTSLSSNLASITAGQSATLSWTSSGATSLSINHSIGAVTMPSGTRSVSPSVTTTYTITATNAAGSRTDSVTITVNQPVAAPTASFSASPASITAGQSATLSYSTTNASSASVNQGVGSAAVPSGTKTVSPSVTTTYTLTVSGAGGTITRTATVTVTQPQQQPQQPPEQQPEQPPQTPPEQQPEQQTPPEQQQPGQQQGAQQGQQASENQESGQTGSDNPVARTSGEENLLLGGSVKIETGAIQNTNGRAVAVDPLPQNVDTIKRVIEKEVAIRQENAPVKVLYNVTVPRSVATAAAPAIAVAQAIETVRTLPELQTVSYAVAMPAAVAISTVATATATTAASSAVGLLTYVQSVAAQVLTFAGRRRDKNKGQVVNSLTGKPVSLAIVRLYDQKTNRLLQTKITDNIGQYQFVVGPGSYRVQVLKEGFDYPATLGNFAGVGQQPIEVTQPKAVIQSNLAIDPSAALSEMPALRLLALRSRQKIQKALVRFGFVLSVVSFAVNPGLFTAALLVFQGLLTVVMKRIENKGKFAAGAFGSVVSTVGKPIGKAVVRLLEPKYHRMISYEVSDGNGHYSFVVNDDKQEFELMAEAAGHSRTVLQSVKAVPGRNFITEKVQLAKLSTTEGVQNEQQKNH